MFRIFQNAPYLNQYLENPTWLTIESCRLQTYPHEIPLVHRKRFSKNGLIYTKIPYILICIYCRYTVNVNLDTVESLDVVHDHHQGSQDCCMYHYRRRLLSNINGYDVYRAHQFILLNRILNFYEPEYFPVIHNQYIDEEHRLRSFERCKVPYMKEKKEMLARNGFIYIISDVIQCFYCGGSLNNLEYLIDKVPYLHAYFYHSCVYSKIKTQSAKRSVARIDFRSHYGGYLSDIHLLNRSEYVVKQNTVARCSFSEVSRCLPYINNDEVANFLSDEDFIKVVPTENQNVNDDANNDEDVVCKNNCVICLCKPATIVTLPCNHIATCDECLVKSQTKTCVYCRSKITSVVKVIYCA